MILEDEIPKEWGQRYSYGSCVTSVRVVGEEYDGDVKCLRGSRLDPVAIDL